MLIKNDCGLLRKLNATDMTPGSVWGEYWGREAESCVLQVWARKWVRWLWKIISAWSLFVLPRLTRRQRDREREMWSHGATQPARVSHSQRQHNQDYIHTSLSATPYNADRSLILFDENCPTKVWKWNLSESKVRTIF